MKKKNIYLNKKWKLFSELVKSRDNNKCVKCNRNSLETILQVHHLNYIKNLNVWDYPLSDCITLCKGCHAREHNLIEPNSGWILTSIDDDGCCGTKCERYKCNSDIRYLHNVYHPEVGHKVVGSTCVEFLTEEDKEICKKTLKAYKSISDFVHNKKPLEENNNFNMYEYKYSKIYIFKNLKYSVLLKNKGKRTYTKQQNKKNKTYYFNGFEDLKKTKELAYIHLKSLIVKDEKEVKTYREIYKKITRI